MQNTKYKRCSLVVLLLVTALCFTGCSCSKQKDTVDEPVLIDIGTGLFTEEEIFGTAPEEPRVEMWNPYKPFTFPEALTDAVQILLADDGLNYTYEFHADVNKQDVFLFSVVLGPDDVPAGYLLGEIKTKEAGKIKVHTVMAELHAADWTAEQYQDLSMKQGYVNEILAQIYEDDAFVRAK